MRARLACCFAAWSGATALALGCPLPTLCGLAGAGKLARDPRRYLSECDSRANFLQKECANTYVMTFNHTVISVFQHFTYSPVEGCKATVTEKDLALELLLCGVPLAEARSLLARCAPSIHVRPTAWSKGLGQRREEAIERSRLERRGTRGEMRIERGDMRSEERQESEERIGERGNKESGRGERGEKRGER